MFGQRLLDKTCTKIVVTLLYGCQISVLSVLSLDFIKYRLKRSNADSFHDHLAYLPNRKLYPNIRCRCGLDTVITLDWYILYFWRINSVYNLEMQEGFLTDCCATYSYIYRDIQSILPARGPKGHITCTWVHCATFLMDWAGRPFLYTNCPEKQKNLVEDVETMLPVKFHWILYSGFREEDENVSANQRPGRLSCFSDRPEKHKLGRWRWYLASCQVSLNSVQRFQRRGRKCLSQSEARAAVLIFRSAREKDIEILIPVKFRWFRSAVSEDKSKMSQPIRDKGGNLVFPICPKNTN